MIDDGFETTFIIDVDVHDVWERLTRKVEGFDEKDEKGVLKQVMPGF